MTTLSARTSFGSRDTAAGGDIQTVGDPAMFSKVYTYINKYVHMFLSIYTHLHPTYDAFL